MRKLLLGLSFLALVGCTDVPAATVALEDAGYTDVQITGYQFFGCGKDDQFSTGFVAHGATGQCVRGVVCSSWFKGATIRSQGRSQECTP